MKKTLCRLAVLFIICCGFACIFQDTKVLLYRERYTTVISSAQVEDYMLCGWYKEPVCRIYNEKNETQLVYTRDYPTMQQAGWKNEPFISVYDTKGREKRIPTSSLSAALADGWHKERPDWEGLWDLKAQIEDYLSSRGDWGVFVQDLKSHAYLSIGEKQYPAASLIKLFTMASVFAQIENGNLEKTQQVERLLYEMICYSDNAACNALTKLSGGGSEPEGFDNDNRIAESLGCAHTARGSYIAESSGRKGYFRHKNHTSPRDCGRLLKAIYQEKLVSPSASRAMLSLLLQQQRTWKIPSALPPETKVANKTGETDEANHDVAIVFSPGGDYILCVLGSGGVYTIAQISEMVYAYFNNG